MVGEHKAHHTNAKGFIMATSLSNKTLGMVLAVSLGAMGVAYVLPGAGDEEKKDEAQDLEAKKSALDNGAVDYNPAYVTDTVKMDDAGEDTGDHSMEQDHSDEGSEASDANQMNGADGADATSTDTTSTDDKGADSSEADTASDASSGSTDSAEGSEDSNASNGSADNAHASDGMDESVEHKGSAKGNANSNHSVTPVKRDQPAFTGTLEDQTHTAKAADDRGEIGAEAPKPEVREIDGKKPAATEQAADSATSAPVSTPDQERVRYALLTVDESIAGVDTVSLTEIQRASGSNGKLYGVSVESSEGANQPFAESVVTYVLGGNGLTTVVRVFPEEDGRDLGGRLEIPGSKNRDPIGDPLPAVIANPAQVVNRALKGWGTARLQSCRLAFYEEVESLERDESRPGVYIATNYWLDEPTACWEVRFFSETTNEVIVRYYDAASGQPLKIEERMTDE